MTHTPSRASFSRAACAPDRRNLGCELRARWRLKALKAAHN